MYENPVTLDTLHQRLVRLESRLCKLMLHFGVDPYERQQAPPAYPEIPRSHLPPDRRMP